MIKSKDYVNDNLTIIPSLYRESEVFQELVSSLIKPLQDQQEVLVWLVNNILNLEVAENYHLDFIGSLVGQSRILADFDGEKYFGFEGSYNSDTFGSNTDPSVGGYWNSVRNQTNSTFKVLNDDDFRRLITARVISNNSDCKTDDLVEVINLLVGNTSAILQLNSHGHLEVDVTDNDGYLSYYLDRVNNIDNILPLECGTTLRIKE